MIIRHAQDYFIKVKKAKEIVERAKQEKAEAKKEIEKKVSTKKKSVKVEENKMVKDIENK